MVLVTISTFFWLSWAILERAGLVLPCEAALYLISCLTANLTARCLLSVTTELLSFISIISHKAIVAFFFFLFWQTYTRLLPGNHFPLHRGEHTHKKNP